MFPPRTTWGLMSTLRITRSRKSSVLRNQVSRTAGGGVPRLERNPARRRPGRPGRRWRTASRRKGPGHSRPGPGRAGGTAAAMPWKAAFMSSWRALSWHELTHGRAAGCSWVTGGASRPGRQRGRGPGRSRRRPPWFCDGPVPPFRQLHRTTDQAGLTHHARDDGHGMAEREIRRLHGEAGSPTP